MNSLGQKPTPQVDKIKIPCRLQLTLCCHAFAYKEKTRTKRKYVQEILKIS